MPVEHVPITLVKAGGSAMFSASCVAALAKCGYSPDDFGTYDGVRARIEDAQKKVSEMQAAGQPVPPELQRLAECQSGHIGMNTCRQRQRGNPCSNVVDGYYANGAACMPHQGGAFDSKGNFDLQTEHGRYTAAEYNAPAQRGLDGGASRPRDPVTHRIEPGGSGAGGAGETARPPEHYPAAQMRDDEKARVRELLARREQEQAQRTQASAQGAGQSGATGPAAGTGPASGTGAASSASDKAPASMNSAADEAAECVMAFREAMEQQMRKKCLDDEASNRAVANGGPNRTPAEGAQHRQQLRDRVKAAEAEVDTARDAMQSQRSTLSGATRRVNRESEAWRQAEAAHAANPTPESDAARRAAAERVMAAQATQRTERRSLDYHLAELDAAERRAGQARRTSSRAENANCLADQAGAIRASGGEVSGGRRDGRAPSTRQGDDTGAEGENEQAAF